MAKKKKANHYQTYASTKTGQLRGVYLRRLTYFWTRERHPESFKKLQELAFQKYPGRGPHSLRENQRKLIEGIE